MSPDLKLNKINTLARKIVYKKAAGVIAQTNYAANKIKQNANPENIVVIPNPVNVIDIKTGNKKKSIVSLGRLSKEKGHKYLIEAFSKIKTNEWELNIIGDGPEKKELLVLCRFQKLKYREIAEILNISEAALKVRMHRILNELRNNFLQIAE